MSGTSTINRIKGDCPNCGPNRWAAIRGHFKKVDHDDDAPVWYQTDHRILQCPACDEVYHQTVGVFSEDLYPVGEGPDGLECEYDEKIRHWPEVLPNSRKIPDWLPKIGLKDLRLEELLEDVYKALSAGVPVLAVIGIRTVFDRATELLGIDPASTFKAKLDDLAAQGFIGPTERDHLSIVTDTGSAAAHRGWKPTDDDRTFVLDIVEGFLNRVFVQRDRAVSLKNAIPQKPSKIRTSTQ